MLSSCMFSLTCLHSLDQFTLWYLNKNWSPLVQKKKFVFPFSFSLLLFLFLALWRITDKINFCFVKYIDSAIWLQISVRKRLSLLPMHILNNMTKRTWWTDNSVYFYSTMGQGPGTHDMVMRHRGQLLVLQLHSYSIVQYKPTNSYESSFFLFLVSISKHAIIHSTLVFTRIWTKGV